MLFFASFHCCEERIFPVNVGLLFWIDTSIHTNDSCVEVLVDLIENRSATVLALLLVIQVCVSPESGDNSVLVPFCGFDRLSLYVCGVEGFEFLVGPVS